MARSMRIRAPLTPRPRGRRTPRTLFGAGLIALALVAAAIDADPAHARCEATLQILGPNGQDSAIAQPVTAVPGQSMRFVARAPGCRLPASCRLRIFAARVDPAGTVVGRLRAIAAGTPGARVLRIERRSVVENSLAFRAAITCGRRVARQSGTLRAIWQPPPPPPPPPSEPAQATHLRLTLTGAQGSAFQERDLVTNTVTQTPTPSGAPSIKASSARTSETIAGTATVDGPLAPGEVLYVYATANLVYHALCNGPSSCTFNVPREPPGTDRFDEVVAMICAGPPAAVTGCGDPRIVEVDVDWDPS